MDELARKKKHPEHVNHERWLISYADFITLLFAFFVVMFAVSQVDTKKLGRFSQSFSQAIGLEVLPATGKGLLSSDSGGTQNDGHKLDAKNGNGLPGDLEQLRAQLMLLKAQRKDELAKLEVLRRKNELVLRLADNILQEPARKVLKPVADLVRPLKVSVRVEGHTDSIPIHSSRWRSNWELSTARATTVVEFLLENGLSAPRLSAAGYGEHHPVASNDLEIGRAKNRRVDLVVAVAEADTEATAP